MGSPINRRRFCIMKLRINRNQSINRGENMKKTLYLITVLCSLILVSSVLEATSLIKTHGPFNITGTISEIKWHGEKRMPMKDRSHGQFSGTYSPAHFIVMLVKYSGVSAEEAGRITSMFRSNPYADENFSGMPPFIILKINSRDRNLLKANMKIRVSGYSLEQYSHRINYNNKGVKIY
jgi:hypothetical protein